MSNTKPATPTPSSVGTRPEKTMSSRLMNLKFMQRAAAVTSSPTRTPSSVAYKTVETNSAKRRKTTDSPVTPAAQASPAPASVPGSAETNNAHVDDYLNGRGETQWTLQFPSNSLKGFSSNGASEPLEDDEDEEEADDDDDDDDDDDPPVGRRTYGTFKSRKIAKPGKDEDADEDAEGEGEATASDEEDETSEKGEDDEEETGWKKKRSTKNMGGDGDDQDDRKLIKTISSISSSRGMGSGHHVGSKAKRNLGKAFAGLGKSKDHKKDGTKKRKRDKERDR